MGGVCPKIAEKAGTLMKLVIAGGINGIVRDSKANGAESRPVRKRAYRHTK